MPTIPPGFGPNFPASNNRAGNPPTYFMDAIAQRNHDQMVGYSSLDPSTTEGRSSGLIDLIKQLARQHSGSETPPMSGLNVHNASNVESADGGAGAYGTAMGHATAKHGIHNPFTSAHSKAEKLRDAALEQVQGQGDATNQLGNIGSAPIPGPGDAN